MGENQRSGVDHVDVDATNLRVAIVCGQFNDAVTLRLLDGARRACDALGVPTQNRLIEWVPGAFEIPLACMTMLTSGAVDAAVGLGAVIRGETSHYDFVAGECARGLQEVGLRTGRPAVFGVLTTESLDQALARSEGPGGHNVGEEAIHVAARMADLTRRYPPAS